MERSRIGEAVDWVEYGDLLILAQLWCQALDVIDAGLETEKDAQKREILEQGRKIAAERCQR